MSTFRGDDWAVKVVSCKLTGFPMIGSTPIHLSFYKLVCLLKSFNFNKYYQILSLSILLKSNSIFESQIMSFDITNNNLFKKKNLLASKNNYNVSGSFSNIHPLFHKFFIVNRINKFYKLCLINFNFNFYKPMFNLIYEIFFCGYNIFFQKDPLFENETLSFFKYIYGFKNFKSNDIIFNDFVYKKNSFIWKNYVTIFSLKNYIRCFILTSIDNKQGILNFFRCFKSPIIVFVDPSYYNPGVDFYFFARKDDYLVRYVYISVILSFYNLYKYVISQKFFSLYFNSFVLLNKQTKSLI